MRNDCAAARISGSCAWASENCTWSEVRDKRSSSRWPNAMSVWLFLTWSSIRTLRTSMAARLPKARQTSNTATCAKAVRQVGARATRGKIARCDRTCRARAVFPTRSLAEKRVPRNSGAPGPPGTARCHLAYKPQASSTSPPRQSPAAKRAKSDGSNVSTRASAARLIDLRAPEAPSPDLPPKKSINRASAQHKRERSKGVKLEELRAVLPMA
mmetsp:Transcript_50830/g.144004  ORF Transcript_50830/g.144004 Transcript_50830/m.144004 type:complete len:213 (-) Transcript_50830:131-769(-)